MTLKEMSVQYRESAEQIGKELRELRQALKNTNDREEAWHIKRRILELTPVLTQLNELAWLLEHYYEVGGGVRDDRYGFCGKRKPLRKRKAEKSADPDTERRINRLTKANLLGLSLSEEANLQDCKRTRCKQVDREQDAQKSGRECHAVPEVLPDVDLSGFFGQSPQKAAIRSGKRRKR